MVDRLYFPDDGDSWMQRPFCCEEYPVGILLNLSRRKIILSRHGCSQETQEISQKGRQRSQSHQRARWIDWSQQHSSSPNGKQSQPARQRHCRRKRFTEKMKMVLTSRGGVL